MLLIELLDMRFYAHHGCFEEERQIGAHFSVDVRIEASSSACVQSDRLEDAVNYQSVYDTVAQEMGQSSHLLEHIAGRVIRRIKDDFPQAGAVRVCISKLNPSLGGQVAASRIVLASD